MNVGVFIGEKFGVRGDGGSEKGLKFRDGGMGYKRVDVVFWLKSLNLGG